MTHGSLFSGIGGFDLAAEWMGWENLFHCEIEHFQQKVLKYYWPNAELFTDIKKSDFTKYANRIDVLSGGFPCQPYSTAGKRLGNADDRHLWPEMLGAIREIKPRWVVGENVRGLVSWNGGMVFDEVQADLEAEGYEVLPFILPAASVNAPHRRDRVWFIAHRESQRDANGQERTGGIKYNELFAAHAINSGYNAGRGTGTETDGIQGIGREEMESREFNGTTTRPTRHPELTGLEGGVGSRGAKGFKSGYQEDDVADTGLLGQAQYELKTTRVEQRSENNIATHTGGIELQGGMHTGGIGEAKRYTGSRHTWSDGCGAWDNFPTQPPVCGRNDGFPTELAGITVSRHRRESIKGYGNAVVPQVVLQIFKAIENYECHKNHK